MDMNDVMKVTIIGALTAFLVGNLWILFTVAHVSLWYPDRVIPVQLWALAQTSLGLVSGLITALVVNVLSKAAGPPKG